VIRGLDGYMAAAVGRGPMPPKGEGMVGYRMHDFDVVFYGDTAVATFIADVDYRNGGRPSKSKLSLLDVYAKENGQWNQVASNTSLHPDYQDELMSAVAPMTDAQKTELLAAREAVWRAWFAGDAAQLATLLPPELVTLGPGSHWAARDAVIADAKAFAAGGGRLVRLAFPRTELQRYGHTVIVYTSYETEVERAGRVETQKGLATEVFVRRGGRWLNTGWQLAPEPSAPGTR
jgi:hypothetical protein